MTSSSFDRSRPAVLQLPLPGVSGSKRSVDCAFNGMQGKRLTVDATEDVPVSSPVSVEYDDALFLGEVVTCAAHEKGWTVEIKVEQILSGLQSLMALRARLLSESIAQAPLTLVPLGARN